MDTNTTTKKHDSLAELMAEFMTIPLKVFCGDDTIPPPHVSLEADKKKVDEYAHRCEARVAKYKAEAQKEKLRAEAAERKNADLKATMVIGGIFGGLLCLGIGAAMGSR